MLESYEHEIIRKRRASRIFWFLVFSFAVFLYFFFQGYYPSIDFSLKEIFSSGGIRRPERDEFVKSFGIINVSVTPDDAKILLSGEQFGNNEKRMVKYGDYLLSVGKPGYTQTRVVFQIDRERPYYIDKIRLIPRASYQKIGEAGAVILTNIDPTSWILKSEQGTTLLDKSLSGGVRIERGGIPIGEGYYASGESIMRYSDGGWEKKSWIGSVKLIRECDESLHIKDDTLWCPKNEKAVTPKGKTYTGITSIGNDFLRTKTKLITKDAEIELTMAEQEKDDFTMKDGIWYMPQDGNLIPLVNQRHDSSLPLITTSLDTIEYTTWVDSELLIFGKKGESMFVGFIEGNTLKKLIPFPSIPLEEVRIEKYSGNIFFKTKTALLFLYNNGDKVEWIIEGAILGFSDEAAIYEKNGELWRASWGEEE